GRDTGADVRFFPGDGTYTARGCPDRSARHYRTADDGPGRADDMVAVCDGVAPGVRGVPDVAGNYQQLRSVSRLESWASPRTDYGCRVGHRHGHRCRVAAEFRVRDFRDVLAAGPCDRSLAARGGTIAVGGGNPCVCPDT